MYCKSVVIGALYLIVILLIACVAVGVQESSGPTCSVPVQDAYGLTTCAVVARRRIFGHVHTAAGVFIHAITLKTFRYHALQLSLRLYPVTASCPYNA